MAVALERQDPDEGELVLDGISRLRAEPVDPARARALVERAVAVQEPWDGVITLFDVPSALIAVLLRWLGGGEHRRVAAAGHG